MPFYETVFIARQDLPPKQVEDMTETFCEIIKDGGGKIAKIESWGLRSLAYRIGKNRKGHYALIESDAPAAALQEMERQMRLNEDILRFLSVRLEEPSKGQSVILDRPGRDFDDTTEQREEAA